MSDERLDEFLSRGRQHPARGQSGFGPSGTDCQFSDLSVNAKSAGPCRVPLVATIQRTQVPIFSGKGLATPIKQNIPRKALRLNRLTNVPDELLEL